METPPVQRYKEGTPEYIQYIVLQEALLSYRNELLNKKGRFLRSVLKKYPTSSTNKWKRQGLIREFGENYKPYPEFHYPSCFSGTHPESYVKTMDRLCLEFTKDLTVWQVSEQKILKSIESCPTVKYWDLILPRDQYIVIYRLSFYYITTCRNLNEERVMLGRVYHSQLIKCLYDLGIDCKFNVHDVIGIRCLELPYDFPGKMIYVDTYGPIEERYYFDNPPEDLKTQYYRLPGRLENINRDIAEQIYKFPFIEKRKL